MGWKGRIDIGNKNNILFILCFIVILSLFGCSNVEIKEDKVVKEETVSTGEGIEKPEKEDDVNNINQQDSKGEKTKVDFVRVVDGDTIKVIYRGEELSVRLLLIDTPETKHPNKGVEPFGTEASEYAKSLFENASNIELEFEGKERDHYNRLLAYVWVDGNLYNKMVVEEGLSRVGYIYGNKLYLKELSDAQEKAKLAKKNIWTVEGYVNENGEGYNLDVYEGKINVTENKLDEKVGTEIVNEKCNIKGNIGKEKIYHLPGGSYYEKTVAEKMFCSESEAVSEGFRASLR